MIVEPDFFDHWKNIILSELLGNDVQAPLYVLRLWGHCQNRKRATLSLSDRALKAVCRFQGDGSELRDALTEAGWIKITGDDEFECHGWEERNSQLLANWENGKKGGRPKGSKNKQQADAAEQSNTNAQKPISNPKETQCATEQTQAEPIRVEKTRSDKNSLSHPREDSKHWKEPAFQAAWQHWLDHCLQRRGSPVSDASQLQQLYTLEGFSTTEAVKVIEYTINRNALNLILNGDHKQGSGHGTPRTHSRRKRPKLSSMT